MVRNAIGYLKNPDNRPTIFVVVFFLIALFYFLFALKIISLPSFSSGNDDKKTEDQVTPSPTDEPTPTEVEEEEEEPTKVPVKKFIPTSTPKPTATNTPAPTSKPTDTPTPTQTPTPSDVTPLLSDIPTPTP
jgi:hypothetical protein